MNLARIVRFGMTVAGMVWCAVILAGCAGSPEATAQWYLRDKPADMRVPVSGQSDPGAQLTPAEE